MGFFGRDRLKELAHLIEEDHHDRFDEFVVVAPEETEAERPNRGDRHQGIFIEGIVALEGILKAFIDQIVSANKPSEDV